MLTILDFADTCFEIVQSEIGHLVLQAVEVHGSKPLWRNVDRER